MSFVRPSFRFDAAACSGCKACQMACRDRHDLVPRAGTSLAASPALDASGGVGPPPQTPGVPSSARLARDADPSPNRTGTFRCGTRGAGRHWRRISELSGGGWTRSDGSSAAWHNDVFAYYLSISCNHCDRPICVEVCPARAITRRDDGVVLLESDHCLGCGYCAWACPYSAPQFVDEAGFMSKCSFCVEDIDAGLDPACVAACPVRALDWGDAEALEERYPEDLCATAPFPLPRPELTEARLRLAPHSDAERSSEPGTRLDPAPPHGLREWSLVAFTILAQMAAGIAICLGFLRGWALHEGASPGGGTLDDRGMLALIAVLLLAMGVSTLHLGQKRNLHRALFNLRSSWLSREILLAFLLLVTAVAASWCGSQPGWEGLSRVLHWSTLPCALALVAGMARIYMLRTVPSWNTRATPLVFLLTALLLGASLLNALVWSQEGPLSALLAWAVWALVLVREVVKRNAFYRGYQRVGT